MFNIRITEEERRALQRGDNIFDPHFYKSYQLTEKDVEGLIRLKKIQIETNPATKSKLRQIGDLFREKLKELKFVNALIKRLTPPEEKVIPEKEIVIPGASYTATVRLDDEIKNEQEKTKEEIMKFANIYEDNPKLLNVDGYLRLEEVCLAAVQSDIRNFFCLTKNDMRFDSVKTAGLKAWGGVIKHMVEQKVNISPEMYDLALLTTPTSLQYFPDQEKTFQRCQSAVERDYNAIEFVPIKYLIEDFCLNALIDNHKNQGSMVGEQLVFPANNISETVKEFSTAIFLEQYTKIRQKVGKGEYIPGYIDIVSRFDKVDTKALKEQIKRDPLSYNRLTEKYKTPELTLWAEKHLPVNLRPLLQVPISLKRGENLYSFACNYQKEKGQTCSLSEIQKNYSQRNQPIKAGKYFYHPDTKTISYRKKPGKKQGPKL